MMLKLYKGFSSIPFKSEVLLKATRSGIYRSKDAGLTWKQVLSNHCYDMEWNTADANIVYAGGNLMQCI